MDEVRAVGKWRHARKSRYIDMKLRMATALIPNDSFSPHSGIVALFPPMQTVVGNTGSALVDVNIAQAVKTFRMGLLLMLQAIPQLLAGSLENRLSVSLKNIFCDDRK